MPGSGSRAPARPIGVSGDESDSHEHRHRGGHCGHEAGSPETDEDELGAAHPQRAQGRVIGGGMLRPGA